MSFLDSHSRISPSAPPSHTYAFTITQHAHREKRCPFRITVGASVCRDGSGVCVCVWGGGVFRTSLHRLRCRSYGGFPSQFSRIFWLSKHTQLGIRIRVRMRACWCCPPLLVSQVASTHCCWPVLCTLRKHTKEKKPLRCSGFILHFPLTFPLCCVLPFPPVGGFFVAC